MKHDLDRLMQDRNLDALWITGAANHNPSLVYFTGVANITRADLLKKRGEEPVLFHYPMEREEAARTGLRCRNFGEFGLDTILQEAGGNSAKAGAIRIGRALREAGIRGNVALAGTVDLAGAYALLSELPSQAPDVRLIGEAGDPVLLRARATKSPEEVERIRDIGRVSTAVIGETADYLCGHSARGEVLVGRGGEPLTIGDVKAFIRRALAGHGAEAPEGTIFAQGRDAAIPHSTGTDAEPLRLGRTIVFDLFPCEMGGGYFYDITRTWCLGHAPDEALRLFEHVRRAYEAAKAKVRSGLRANQIQPAVCTLFEADGHPTISSDQKTERGYVHLIGHGLGLDVHESPSFSPAETNQDVLLPGAVFTIEPGLYYPERGLGVRLENTVWIRPDGIAEVVADYPLDLVLPVRGRGTKTKPRNPAGSRKSLRKPARPLIRKKTR